MGVQVTRRWGGSNSDVCSGLQGQRLLTDVSDRLTRVVPGHPIFHLSLHKGVMNGTGIPSTQENSFSYRSFSITLTSPRHLQNRLEACSKLL
eukprot:2070773-Amphidinium_carterae.1